MIEIITSCNGVKVIFVTLTPIKLETWNSMRLRQGKTGSLKHEGEYNKMQGKLELAVLEINRRVTSINESRGLHTLFLHSEVI